MKPDTTPRWLKEYRRKVQEQLSRIHIEDGLDSSEAQQVAQIYMNEYISGCGATENPKLINGKWKSELRIGLTGRRSDSVIEVDAKTGGVSSSAGPTFATFRELADDIVDGLADRREGHRTER